MSNITNRELPNTACSVYPTSGILRRYQAVSYTLAFFLLDGSGCPRPSAMLRERKPLGGFPNHSKKGQLKLITLAELERIVRENGKLEGWDFSRINTDREPIPWDYPSVVRSYLKPTDRVLDIGTGGGEIFLSLASNIGEGIGIDSNPAMLHTAKGNQSRLAIRNIEFIEMNGSHLKFEGNDFDVVLLRHLRVYVGEILQALRPGGYFITQMVGKRSSRNFLEAFGWTSDSFRSGWWQPVGELAEQFQEKGCRIVAQGEYDVRYWFKDIASFMFWMMSIPWPEEIKLEKHWQNINRILETSQTERGIETNEHRGLLIVQKL